MRENIQRLAGLSIFSFLILSFGLLYWQVVRAPELAARPDNPRLVEQSMRIQRGNIYDRQGRPLVLNEMGPGGFVVRRYLYPSLAPVTGFLNPILGPSGIENALDATLSGGPESDLVGWLTKGLMSRPQKGADLILTIDLDLQEVADRAMGSSPGAVLAINPKTGAILALVSRPSFDPNLLVFHLEGSSWEGEHGRTQAFWEELKADAARPLLNRATQGLYSPGSTFKTVTLAAALESRVARPDTRFPMTLLPPNAEHPGYWHQNEYVSCHNHPAPVESLDLVGAYAWSCNVVFSELGLKLGSDAYQEYARRFGLEEKPPLEIPAEASRIARRSDFFKGAERLYALASTAMGQGELAVTPLQMALIVSAVANGGIVPKPHLVAAVRQADETTTYQASSQGWKRAMAADTAAQVKEIMVASVDWGWAKSMALPGVKVAGKTGTAEHGGPGEPHSWFVGFAPADDPQVAIAVVKEFGGAGSAGAGPIARAVLAAAMKGSPKP